MRAKDYVQIAYKDAWYDHVGMEEAGARHLENVKACREAVAWHEKKDRPLSILAIHGSGRSNFLSCARELSNSQMLLHDALLPLYDKPSEYEVTEVPLRSYNVQVCNNCYATTSALCGFPCDCYPVDPMQDLYPLVLRCDILFISTGVNQSAMAGRLKIFLDRLISLDGGFYREKLYKKDAEFKDRCLALSISQSERQELNYDARLWGRVAAYFITSKDQANESETIARDFETPLNYIELTAHPLRDGNADYGFFHDKDDWYAGAWANPDEELAYDKRWYAQHPEFSQRAALVVEKAVSLAKKLRENPPPFDGGGRGRSRT